MDTHAPRRVLRYVVPIDDEHHEIAAGRVLMASPQRGDEYPARALEVWVEAEVLSTGDERLGDPAAANTITAAALLSVTVIGTGQLVPDDAEHLASCIDRRLVWHLYQVAGSQS